MSTSVSTARPLTPPFQLQYSLIHSQVTSYSEETSLLNTERNGKTRECEHKRSLRNEEILDRKKRARKGEWGEEEELLFLQLEIWADGRLNFSGQSSQISGQQHHIDSNHIGVVAISLEQTWLYYGLNAYYTTVCPMSTAVSQVFTWIKSADQQGLYSIIPARLRLSRAVPTWNGM